jgi:hypothetical protein
MDKKILLIGVGLIVLAIILFFISGYLLSNGLGSSIKATNLTVQHGGFSTVPVSYYSNTSAVAIYVISEQPTNLYLLNSTQFTIWNTYMNKNKNASGIKYVRTLGVNSSYIYSNTTLSVLPLNVKNIQVQNTFNNQIYVVIDNSAGSKSTAVNVNATVSYLPLQSSRLAISTGLGYVVIIVAITGLAFAIWGAIRKDRKKAAEAALEAKGMGKSQKDKDYVDQLYKGVKGKKKKGKDDSQDS